MLCFVFIRKKFGSSINKFIKSICGITKRERLTNISNIKRLSRDVQIHNENNNASIRNNSTLNGDFPFDRHEQKVTVVSYKNPLIKPIKII